MNLSGGSSKGPTHIFDKKSALNSQAYHQKRAIAQKNHPIGTKVSFKAEHGSGFGSHKRSQGKTLTGTITGHSRGRFRDSPHTVDVKLDKKHSGYKETSVLPHHVKHV